MTTPVNICFAIHSGREAGHPVGIAFGRPRSVREAVSCRGCLTCTHTAAEGVIKEGGNH